MTTPTINETVVERQDCITRALKQGDVETLYRYAELYAKEGEDEAAEHVLNLITRI